MPLHIAEYPCQIPVRSAYDQMHMTGHDTPRIHFKIFMLYTITKAIHNDIAILPPDKNIYPVDRCKTHKIQL